MEIIKRKHCLTHFSSLILESYFPSKKMGVFDIETLGLNPSNSKCILAGLMLIDQDNQCEIIQYFAENPSEEKELLSNICKDLNKLDYIITYNGKHFDLPFIKKRMALLNFQDLEIRPFNLDLYLFIQGHSDLNSIIGNLKQKEVEKYMGLHSSREDEVSGKETIQLYFDYLNSNEHLEKNNLKEKILLHNHDDILQLYQLIPILLQTNIHRGMGVLGFPISAAYGWPQLNISKIRIVNKELVISGSYYDQSIIFSNYMTTEYPYECHFTSDYKFQFKIKLEKYKNNIFVDLTSLFEDITKFKKYPGYVNGYLILIENQKKNDREINMLAKELLSNFMFNHKKNEL